MTKKGDIKVENDCEVCDKSFNSRSHLLRHIKEVHNNQATSECEVCYIKIKESSMKRHMLIHTGNTKIHKCGICQERFNSLYSVRLHKEVVHGIPRFVHACNLCHKSYTQRVDLQNHMARIHMSTDHLCEVCGVGFTTKRKLEYHLSFHITERDVQKDNICKLCGVNFESSEKLKNHMSLHLSGRRFFCDLCMDGFEEKKQLIKHIHKTHNGLF